MGRDFVKEFIKKNYALFIIGFMYFLMGAENSGYQVSLISISDELGLIESTKGLIVAVQYAAMLIATLIFGSFGDRFGKKKMTIIFLMVLVSGCGLITFSTDITMFGIGIFLVGAGLAMANTLVTAAIIDIYPVSNSRRMTLAQIMYSLGAVLAPLIFSALMNNGMNWRYVFTTIGVLSLIAGIGYSVLNYVPQEVVFESSNSDTGENETNSNKLPWLFISLFIILFVVYVGTETGFAYFIGSFFEFNLNARVLAAGCISLFWAMEIIGRIISAVLNKYKYKLLIVCFVGMTLSVLLMGSSTSVTTAYVFAGLAGLFCGPVYPLLASIGVSLAPKKTATVSGFFVASSGVGGMVIPLILGSIGGSVGYNFSFYFLGAFVLIAVAAYTVFLVKAKPESKKSTKN